MQNIQPLEIADIIDPGSFAADDAFCYYASTAMSN
jgi:hypothetical protein